MCNKCFKSSTIVYLQPVIVSVQVLDIVVVDWKSSVRQAFLIFFQNSQESTCMIVQM